MTQSTSVIYSGVLELNSGKTYGRQIRTTKKEGKLLYGIRHHYTDLPPVKAPFDIRNQQRGGTCSRYVKDKYVLFQLKPPTKNPELLSSSSKITEKQYTERPEVQLIETIGDVDNFTAFSNYRAYSLGLKMSSSWTKELQIFRGNKETATLLERVKSTIYENPQNNLIISPTQIHIFTIDPEGCKDMDDGVGISKIGDGIYDISVAITHVPSFLVAAQLTTDQLIKSLNNTCSLYMTERVVNMIPKQFAEQLCSFTETNIKPALVMKMTWDRNTMTATKPPELSIESVFVTKNYVYDTDELMTNPDYMILSECVNEMTKTYKQFSACSHIKDSHDVIAYLMTLMNFYVMEWFEHRELPCVYRLNRQRDDVILPVELEHIRRKVGNYAGEYCDATIYKKNIDPEKLTLWAHITSPMRRLADLTNMMSIAIYIQPNQYKEQLSRFRDYCLTIIPRISQEYKMSRWLSLDCELFAFVKSAIDDGTLLTRLFNGIVIQNDNIENNTKTHVKDKTKIVIYIEELSRFFMCEYSKKLIPYQQVHCRIIAFDEGHSINEKVRVVILDN